MRRGRFHHARLPGRRSSDAGPDWWSRRPERVAGAPAGVFHGPSDHCFVAMCTRPSGLASGNVPRRLPRGCLPVVASRPRQIMEKTGRGLSFWQPVVGQLLHQVRQESVFQHAGDGVTCFLHQVLEAACVHIDAVGAGAEACHAGIPAIVRCRSNLPRRPVGSHRRPRHQTAMPGACSSPCRYD